MILHLSLSDSKSLIQDSSENSRRLQQCCVLEGLDSFSDFQSHPTFLQAFRERSKRTNDNCYHCHRHVPQLWILRQGPSICLPFRFLKFFTLCPTRTAKSTRRQFLFSLLINTRSGLLARNLVIRLYLKIQENFIRLILKDGFWLVHIPFSSMIKLFVSYTIPSESSFLPNHA